MIENERFYLRHGKVSHLRARWCGVSVRGAALCGRDPWEIDWFGTGSQEEYEKAAALPLCKDCAKKARWRA